MNADEIVGALRSCSNHDTRKPDCENCPLFGERLCVKKMLEGGGDLIESLQAQLAASQRRERAAVADLEYACGSSGDFELRSICDICRRKQTDGTCPTQCEMNSLAASNKWEWRGPIEAGKGE